MLLLCLTGSAYAQGDNRRGVSTAAKECPNFVTEPADEDYGVKVFSGNGTNAGTITPESITQRGIVSCKSITSVADLAGEYVMTYKTLSSDSYDGGNAVTVAAVEGTDSVTISSFWDEDIIVKGRVDITAMTLYIPSQTIGYMSGYGYYDLAVSSLTGVPDRTAEITASISQEGTITFDSYWGTFINEGTYADYYFGYYYSTALEVPNATMSDEAYYSSGNVTTSYSVIVTQTAEETLSVKNFFNHGGTVKITLGIDSVPTIEKQAVYTNSRGYWCTYALTYADGYSGIASSSNPITGNAATDSRTVSWNAWNAACSYSGSMLWNGEYIVGSNIVTDFDISYPVLTQLAIEGDGTAESPYLVGSTDNWNNLARYMRSYNDSLTGKYVKITADIDFTGTDFKQLGYNRTEIFNGDLDGNGKTIKGITGTSYQAGFGGLVVTAGENSLIHDITVEGEVSSDYMFTGGVVGYLYGSLSNVTARVDVDANESYAAGIVGYAAVGSTLTSCVNEGTVTTYSPYAAGIVGRNMRDVTYVDCVNRGTVTYSGTGKSAHIGGIVSQAYCCTMERCVNEGVITVTNSGSGYAAGLIAYVSSSSSDTQGFALTDCYNTGNVTSSFMNSGLIATGTQYSTITMARCYNTGDITSSQTSNSANTYTTGLVGYYTPGSSYTDCYNTGKITSYGTNYTSGLLGYSKDGSSSTPTYISRCYNTGEVSSPAQYAAGIVSQTPAYTYIDSCFNTGDITGSYYIGGITGYISAANTSVTNCWNAGNVTASASRTGGIVGSVGYSIEISNCFNTGDITSTSATQGATLASSGYAIGGIAGFSAAKMTDVYNTGTITGVSRVGGIIGSSYRSQSVYTSLERAYSAGKINAPADTCGNIIGNSLINNGLVWNSNCHIADTYFLAENNAVADSLDRDSISTGLTHAQLASLDLGENWIAGDDYTYPLISSLADNDYAKAHAAAVIPAEGDSYSSITQGFNVGTPDGVVWTASPDVVEFNGNVVTFSATCQGTLTLTATAGDVSVSTCLDCDIDAGGVAAAQDGGNRYVVNERIYTLDGVQISSSSANPSAIYIIVKTFNDGSTCATKERR